MPSENVNNSMNQRRDEREKQIQQQASNLSDRVYDISEGLGEIVQHQMALQANLFRAWADIFDTMRIANRRDTQR